MTRSLRHELRHRTSTAHDKLDASLDLLGPPLDADQYTRLLGRFLGFHRGIEPAMFALLDPSLSAGRSKLAALEADLLACHLSPAMLSDLPTVDHLPAIDTPSAALGALYVTEGSTLGGQLILRHIATNRAIPTETKHYFDIYGSDTGANWRVACEAIDLIEPGPDAETAIDTATAIFDCLQQWLDPATWRQRNGWWARQDLNL